MMEAAAVCMTEAPAQVTIPTGLGTHIGPGQLPDGTTAGCHQRCGRHGSTADLHVWAAALPLLGNPLIYSCALLVFMNLLGWILWYRGNIKILCLELHRDYSLWPSVFIDLVGKLSGYWSVSASIATGLYSTSGSWENTMPPTRPCCPLPALTVCACSLAGRRLHLGTKWTHGSTCQDLTEMCSCVQHHLATRMPTCAFSMSPG